MPSSLRAGQGHLPLLSRPASARRRGMRRHRSPSPSHRTCLERSDQLLRLVGIHIVARCLVTSRTSFAVRWFAAVMRGLRPLRILDVTCAPRRRRGAFAQSGARARREDAQGISADAFGAAPAKAGAHADREARSRSRQPAGGARRRASRSISRKGAGRAAGRAMRGIARRWGRRERRARASMSRWRSGTSSRSRRSCSMSLIRCGPSWPPSRGDAHGAGVGGERRRPRQRRRQRQGRGQRQRQRQGQRQRQRPKRGGAAPQPFAFLRAGDGI